VTGAAPHVLVSRLDNEGDVLLAGPAVRAIAARARRVTLLCGPRGQQAARLLPGVDEVMVFRAPWIDPEPEPVHRERALALVDVFAALEIDEAFVLTSFHQSALPLALLLKLAAVPLIAATSEDYPGSLLDVRHRVDDGVHEVARSLSLVETLGYELPPGDEGLLQICRPRGIALPRLPNRFVVVHPGASVPARAWTADHHAELVDALVEAGHRVVVTGAASDRALTARVARAPRERVVDLGGHTSLAALAEVLRCADTVVAGNTGPAHLAAAVGTPVVSIYAPTVPAARWRPWGVPHVLLGDQTVPCSGCRARICPFEGHPCIGNVAVPEVVAAVGALRETAVRPQGGERVAGRLAA
jgi:ADP-heptose:LPS heptosyltransferase